MAEPEQKKKKVTLGVAWREARELILRYRSRMVIGFLIMLINQLAGLELPASSKFRIDTVLQAGQRHLLLPIALAVLGEPVAARVPVQRGRAGEAGAVPSA